MTMTDSQHEVERLSEQWPNEFLGRCQTCLDNAMLSEEPCKPDFWRQGHPIVASDCLIYRARAARALLNDINRKTTQEGK